MFARKLYMLASLIAQPAFGMHSALHPMPDNVFLDMHVTDIDPERGTILDIAAVLTDQNYNVRKEVYVVVHHEAPVLANINYYLKYSIDHLDLPKKVSNSIISMDQAERQMCSLFSVQEQPRSSILVGADHIISFRAFLKKFMPIFDQHISLVTPLHVPSIRKFIKYGNPSDPFFILEDTKSPTNSFEKVHGLLEELKYYKSRYITPNNNTDKEEFCVVLSDEDPVLF